MDEFDIDMIPKNQRHEFNIHTNPHTRENESECRSVYHHNVYNNIYWQ